MANTVTIPKSTYEDLVARVEGLEKLVAGFFQKYGIEPPEGTEAWWKWADKKGRKAIKKDEYVTLKTQKDIDEFFKNL